MSCRISGRRVTIPLPRGRKSLPTMFSRTEDLPDDCEPTTTCRYHQRNSHWTQMKVLLTICGKSRESLPMVLKTRSWSLLTVPKRSSPRVVIAAEAYSRLEPGVCFQCTTGSRFDVCATKVENGREDGGKAMQSRPRHGNFCLN